MQGGSGRQAAALLEEEPALAWIRDDETGGYPVHIACWKVCRGELRAIQTQNVMGSVPRTGSGRENTHKQLKPDFRGANVF